MVKLRYILITTFSVNFSILFLPIFFVIDNCGKCARIVGIKGNVTVKIVDKCPECLSGAIDLHQSAFAQLADVSLGRVKLSWKFVPCPQSSIGGSSSTGIQVKFKDGCNDYWVAIQARNHIIGIKQIQIAQASAPTLFEDLTRQDYNYFVKSYASGVKKPFTVRVIAEDGQVIDESVTSFTATEVKQTTKQFIVANTSTIVNPTTSANTKKSDATRIVQSMIALLFLFALAHL